MEYWCDWYVYVIVVQVFLVGCIVQCGYCCQGMQYQLLVSEVYVFGQVGGVGCIECGGVGVFIEVWEGGDCCGFLQIGFIFGYEICWQWVIVIVQQNLCVQVWQLFFDVFQYWQEFMVGQQYLCVVVIECIGDLFGGQVDVYYYQYCIDYWYGEVVFQIVVVVLVYYCYGIVVFDFQ